MLHSAPTRFWVEHITTIANTRARYVGTNDGCQSRFGDPLKDFQCEQDLHYSPNGNSFGTHPPLSLITNFISGLSI